MPRRLGVFVTAAMVLGVLTGLAVNQWLTPAAAKDVAGNLSIVTDIFLRLIKMIIAPLVFSTLVIGIAHMEDTAAIGRVGVKTLGWFVSAGVVSLSLACSWCSCCARATAWRCRTKRWPAARSTPAPSP